MNINYYRQKKEIEERSANKSMLIKLFSVVLAIIFVACGCSNMKGSEENTIPEPVVQQENLQQVAQTPTDEEENKDQDTVDIVEEDNTMIAYDMVNVGRSDPFMPAGELAVYQNAKEAATKEANAHNARVAELKKLRGKTIREADDISPYSFNLPVPPTSLAPAEAAAAKITRTKVVGIMYNRKNPSALINVDDKDYLVREGDKIIGQEYKVIQIDPSIIVVSLGSNVYSAGIGELFSKDKFGKSNFQNDIYNIESRFGGRKG